jgi:Cys-tRNA(Pro) deacylase
VEHVAGAVSGKADKVVYLSFVTNVTPDCDCWSFSDGDINKVTGYIRGGCSPIGMKKNYTTVLDNSSNDLDYIVMSAGKIGHQIKIAPSDLIGLIKCKTSSLIINK